MLSLPDALHKGVNVGNGVVSAFMLSPSYIAEKYIVMRSEQRIVVAQDREQSEQSLGIAMRTSTFNIRIDYSWGALGRP